MDFLKTPLRYTEKILRETKKIIDELSKRCRIKKNCKSCVKVSVSSRKCQIDEMFLSSISPELLLEEAFAYDEYKTTKFQAE